MVFADDIAVTINAGTPESACALANDLTGDNCLILADISLSLSLRKEKRKNISIYPRLLPSFIFLREDGLRYPSTALRLRRRHTFDAKRENTVGDYDPGGPLFRQSPRSALKGAGPSWRPF